MLVLHSLLPFLHGIGTFRTDSIQAVTTGMCFLLLRLISRLAPAARAWPAWRSYAL